MWAVHSGWEFGVEEASSVSGGGFSVAVLAGEVECFCYLSSLRTDRVDSGAVAVAGGFLGVPGSGAGDGFQEILSADIAFSGFSSLFYKF